MSLRGFSKGKSQAELIKAARNYAEIYFATACVSIELSNEQTEGIWICDNDPTAAYVEFSAEWGAEEKHSWIIRTNKPAKCIICKKEKL